MSTSSGSVEGSLIEGEGVVGFDGTGEAAMKVECQLR